MICVGDEDWVDSALQSGHNIGTQICHRANEVLILHENVGHEIAKDDGADPCSNETLNGLLWRELDKLRATECNTANICKDVVRNDERCGQEEPDHALKDVVHDEMSLHDNQVQRHVSPSKLGELETIMAFLQRGHEEDEPYDR